MQVVGVSIIALIAFGAGLGISWIISTRNARGGLRKAREQASRILVLAEEEADTLRESNIRGVDKELSRRQVALNTQHAILKKIAQELLSDRKELAELDAHLRELEKNLEKKVQSLRRDMLPWSSPRGNSPTNAQPLVYNNPNWKNSRRSLKSKTLNLMQGLMP